MKSVTALLLLAGAAHCLPQIPKDGQGEFLMKNAGTWPLVDTVSVKPVYRNDTKRVVLKYGPLDLFPKSADKGPISKQMAMDKNGQSGAAWIKDGLCKSCSIVSAIFKLAYENGTKVSPANGVYIHHFVSYDASKPIKDPITGCSGGFGIKTAAFVDSGEDSGEGDTIFTTPDGKYDSGYHMESGSILAQYDLVNYDEVSKKIIVELEVEYREGLEGKDAGHVLKSVTCSGGVPPAVGERATVTTSKGMEINSDATIVWARGHLHAGGTKMVLMVDGKEVCTSLPRYNARGVITEMSLCPEPISLKKGQMLTMASEYDTSKHKLRESSDGSAHAAMNSHNGGSDVMGMFMISYAYV